MNGKSIEKVKIHQSLILHGFTGLALLVRARPAIISQE
ncbi:MAG: hypothetical protein ANABAC_2818 [Anaerolineae bacterium]|nr:MAG: hypothetical protein ANABAC_2818 [Anaerolineae bacterium]